MIAYYLLFLGVFLATTVTAIGNDSDSNQILGEGKGEKTVGALRGGRFGNGKKSVVPSSSDTLREDDTMKNIRLLSFGEEQIKEANGEATIIDEVKHVMIACKSTENEYSCRNRIWDAIPEEAQDRFRFTNYLQLPNVHAAEIRGDTSILDNLEGVVDDAPRETMHIKDSIQVHRSLQSSGQAIPYGIEMVKATEVWEKFQTKGENVRICVMDTGVHRDHPDLDSNRLFGYDGNELVQPWWRDTDGHGTHVTGTIAASDNNQGVVGVAPGAEIFTARVFSTNGQFFSSNIIAALQVCKDGGAKVISMSLGGTVSIGYERQAYEDLEKKFGIVTVAASGNTGGYDFLYPAAYDNVISVASVNWNGDRSSFSTRNNKLDVAAPGSSILSTWENGSYATVSGTSMACPHVSGVVALMLSVNPSATPAELISAIQTSAENPSTTGKDSYIGYGIVNALAAVEAISNNDSNNNDSSNDSVPGNVDENNSSSNSGAGSSTGNDASGCVDLVITLRTDRYAYDTYHWLQEGSQTLFYHTNLDSFQTYQFTSCIDPLQCTIYNIRDKFGDGISGEGLEIIYGGEVVYSGGNFGVGGIKYLGSCSQGS